MPPNNRRLQPRSKRCGCLQACNYYMLRCDSCHRGVHFGCLNFLAEPNVFVCNSCKNHGVEEVRVAEIRRAEEKPCAVTFHGSCHYHVGEVRGRKIRPAGEEHADEELSGSLCDICNSTCQFFDIVCDNCDVDWHTQCVGVTRELAERIDKWYCERCLDKDARLRIAFKDGQGAEGVDNAVTTPPPGPSREPTVAVHAARCKKRPATATEATDRSAKKAVTAVFNEAMAKTEVPSEVEAVESAEDPPTMEASATAEEEHLVTVQPTVETLVEQLKEAQARNKTLEDEKAALLREKTAAASAKEDLQKALGEAKAGAASERVKRVAAEEEMAKSDRIIARLNARLLELNQL